MCTCDLLLPSKAAAATQCASPTTTQPGPSSPEPSPFPNPLHRCMPRGLILPICPENMQHLMTDLGSTWQGGTTAASRYNPLCWDHLAFSRARRATCLLCQGPASAAARPRQVAIQHSHFLTATCFGVQAVSSPLCNAGYIQPEHRYEGVVPGPCCGKSLEVQKSVCTFTLNNNIR